MKTIICGLGLLAFAGCSTQPPPAPVLPAVATPTTEFNVSEFYPLFIQSLWDDYSASEQQGMCDLYDASPETVRAAFTSGIDTGDQVAAWGAMRDFLDEEC